MGRLLGVALVESIDKRSHNSLSWIQIQAKLATSTCRQASQTVAPMKLIHRWTIGRVQKISRNWSWRGTASHVIYIWCCIESSSWVRKVKRIRIFCVKFKLSSSADNAIAHINAFEGSMLCIYHVRCDSPAQCTKGICANLAINFFLQIRGKALHVDYSNAKQAKTQSHW